MALDAGFDIVIPYPNIQEDEVEGLVQDIIFSRGPKGAKQSGILIGGNRVELCEKMAKIVKKSMFPPFQASVMLDPKGAYTTAAGMVAKAKKSLSDLGMGEFKNKRVVVFGGTGPVGKIAAVLSHNEGNTATMVTSQTPEFVKQKVDELNSTYKTDVKGAAAKTAEERVRLIRENDVILATLKAGVQLITKEMLKNIGSKKLVADVNAVPPSGIEGLEAQDDKKEIAPNVFGIGALAIGQVKYQVESGLFKKMLESTCTLDFKDAYELAQTLS
jgi:methylene-tetrahydromethanopterin dehydrogenase